MGCIVRKTNEMRHVLQASKDGSLQDSTGPACRVFGYLAQGRAYRQNIVTSDYSWLITQSEGIDGIRMIRDVVNVLPVRW
jgi:hypothetical protein